MDMITQNMMMQQPTAMTAGNDMNAGLKGQAADEDSGMFAQMMEAAGAQQGGQTDDADPADALAQSMASQFMQTAPVNLFMTQFSEVGNAVQTGILSGVFGLTGTEIQPENTAAGMMLQNMQTVAGAGVTAENPLTGLAAEPTAGLTLTAEPAAEPAAGLTGVPVSGLAAETGAPAADAETVLTESGTLTGQSDADKSAVWPAPNETGYIAETDNVQTSARSADSGQTDLSGGQQTQTAMADAKTAESQETEKNSRVSADHTEQMQFNPSSGTSAERHVQVQQKTETSPVLHFSSADQTENMQKLSELIKNAVNSSVKELEIQLEPANLGKIVLKATYEAGKAAVVISCTNPGTLETLSRHAAELGGLIQDHMGGQTEIVIDQPQQQYLNQDGRNGGQDTREEQREQHERQKNRPAQGDFLEQLRLGLV